MNPITYTDKESEQLNPCPVCKSPVTYYYEGSGTHDVICSNSSECGFTFTFNEGGWASRYENAVRKWNLAFPIVPQRELTQEEEKQIKEACFHTRKMGVPECEYGGHIVEGDEHIDNLLSIIQQLRQQPDRKAWLEKVAERADEYIRRMMMYKVPRISYKEVILQAAQEVEGGV